MDVSVSGDDGVGVTRRNEGDVNVALWVTYIIPEGKPLAETDLSHCDA